MFDFIIEAMENKGRQVKLPSSAPRSVTVSDNTSDNDGFVQFKIAALTSAPVSAERADLLGRLSALKSDVEAFLQETRSARLADLTTNVKPNRVRCLERDDCSITWPEMCCKSE